MNRISKTLRSILPLSALLLSACLGDGGGGTTTGGGSTTPSYTIGGTVSGLNGSMVLQNNGTDDLTVPTNGAFTFPTAVTYGTPYSVTQLSQQFPSQVCTISNGSGTVTGNVSNVAVNCVVPAHAGYDVTIVATGVSSGGAWVGNTWTATASGSQLLASEIQTHLANGPTVISTGGGDYGDIVVATGSTLSWSANTLTLRAARNIGINAALTGTGTAGLALEYGQGAPAAGNTAVYRISTPVSLDSPPLSLPLPSSIPVTVPPTPVPDPLTASNFSTKRGSDGSVDGRAVPLCPKLERGIGWAYPGCSFLVTTVNGQVFATQYKTVEVNAAADTDNWVYVEGFSLFAPGVTIYPYAMACQASQGNLYFPSSDFQVNDFGPGGAITDMTNLVLHTTTNDICKPWYGGPVHIFSDSTIFINGYYVRFVPNAGESGNAYQIMSVLFTNQVSGNTSYTVVDYVINVIPDTAPDAFAFTGQTNVALSTQFESNAITVTGITNAAPISVTGGEYQINGGAWTSTAGTVNKNDTVKVRHTSSAANLTTTNTALTIGSGSGTFSTTTW